ncbi:hypothetical protein [Allocoleopsis sp.]
MPNRNGDQVEETDETTDYDNSDLFEAPGTEPPGQESLWEITETTQPSY